MHPQIDHDQIIKAEREKLEARIEELEAVAREAKRLIGFMTNAKIAEASRVLSRALPAPPEPREDG